MNVLTVKVSCLSYTGGLCYHDLLSLKASTMIDLSAVVHSSISMVRVTGS